jgi:hypothetical protein
LPPYRITGDDRLWAARAAHFEGGHDPADTLWTWTQRFALPARRRIHGTLSGLIKAHSQPVNPIWRRDGSKCRPGGSHHNHDYCAERRLVNRDRAATMSFSETRPEVQQKVNAWANGQLPNPVPRSVDFAAPNVTRSFLGRNPGSRLLKEAGNWFVGTRTSLGWPDGHVTISPGTAAGSDLAKAIAIPVVGGALVLVAAGFAYWAWRRQR